VSGALFAIEGKEEVSPSGLSGGPVPFRFWLAGGPVPFRF
jgi:hypothetical protein